MNFITKQVENKVGIDLNGDGIIGSGSGHSKGHGSNGGSLINTVENALHMDLNGDGQAGANYNNHRGDGMNSNFNPNGGPVVNPNFNQHGGGGGGMLEKLEDAIGMDLSGDGRAGGLDRPNQFDDNY